MTKKCLGCGSILQSINQNEVGYYPSKLEKPTYCERCFKLINYNKDSIGLVKKAETEIIDIINKKAKLVFFLVDFLNINDESIEKFKKVKQDKILVINKCDILPKSIKEQGIIKWLKEVYNIDDEIIFVSAIKKYNLGKIPKIMYEKGLNECYLLGYTNVGKSSLINILVEKNIGRKGMLTTSKLPNTTLDFIKIKIDDLTIVDSPGLILKNSLYDITDIEIIKRIINDKTIKPITYQTKDNTIINIEDRILITSSINNSYTLYMSNNLKIKKIYKISNDNFKKITVNIDDNSDLVIKGIGFINIKKKCTINLYVENEKIINIRKSCF